MTLEIDIQKKIQEGYRKFLENNSLRSRVGQKQMISLVANTVGNIKQDADRKSTRLNSSHSQQSRMPSSA